MNLSSIGGDLHRWGGVELKEGFFSLFSFDLDGGILLLALMREVSSIGFDERGIFYWL
jgi:hypothetical protein